MPVMEGENQTPLQYDIRFENVSFQYEQNQSDVIHDVSFYIPEKEMTAIVGPSGMRKNDIDTADGPVLWDVGLRVCFPSVELMFGKFTPNSFTLISVSYSRTFFLFHDTIENNIKFGNPAATHEEVVAGRKESLAVTILSSLCRMVMQRW